MLHGRGVERLAPGGFTSVVGDVSFHDVRDDYDPQGRLGRLIVVGAPSSSYWQLAFPLHPGA
jgi:hypothetical protein